MFLIRLMYLSSMKSKKTNFKIDKTTFDNPLNKKEIVSQIENNGKTVNQIKNIAQEKKNKPEINNDIKGIDKSLIHSFDELLNICSQKKEIHLKYELEKNVNLVKFERKRIEISFNDNLNKNFVKDLSSKLFEWTNERWIITFSKSKGEMSVKEKKKNIKEELKNEIKNLEIYKIIMKQFPDAELLDVKLNKEED